MNMGGNRHFKRDDWIVLFKHLSWPVPLPAVKARTTPPASRGRGGFYAAEPNDSDPQPARSTPMARASMARDRRRNRARLYDKPAAGVMNRKRSSTAAGVRDRYHQERTWSSRMADISVHMMAERNVRRICWSRDVLTSRDVLYSLTSLVTSRPTVRMGLETKPTVEIQIGINTGGPFIHCENKLVSLVS